MQVASTQLTPGYLEVILLEVSRLNLDPGIVPSEIEIHCTMSVDTTPWVCLTQYSGVPYMVLDLIVSKISSQQLGVVFKQETVAEIGQNCVLVETIVAGSPASIAEMKRGDILVAVNGKRVSNMNQVAKFVKSATQRRFIIRVERKYLNWIKIDFERVSLLDRNSDRKSSKSDSGISRGDPAGFEEASKLKLESQIKFSDLKEPEFESLDKGELVSKLFKRRKSSAHNPTLDDIFQTPETPSRRISTTSNLSTSSSNAQSYGDDNIPSLADLYYMTKEKEFASVITFEETRSFQIDSEQQYLNIGVWSRMKGGDSTTKLLGYINAPIKLILAQCSTSSTGHYLKWHALLPPDSATATSSVQSKLQGYSGFDPILCYGDILLSYGWFSTNSQKQTSDDGIKKGTGEAAKSQTVASEEHVIKKHDFIRTHFHRATHCDFCTKKIWLKDAVQCRDCGLVCHKKCESRCLASGPCGAESLATFEADEVETNSVSGDTGPEISFTGCEENVQAPMMAMKATIANTLLGLKKAGSTSCLAPPTAGTGLASRSLPQSPCASRKNSLVGGLGISPDLLEGAEPSVASSLLAGDLDDGLMTKAKDTGQYLYKYLEPQDRIDKINSMITKLKTALDVETTSRVELSQNSESDSIKLISQSDLRVQALSVLLLHYCTGLQHAQEAFDRPKNDKSL